MDYCRVLRKIEDLRKYGSQPGLDRVRMLLDYMGNPQDKLEFVHVTGTNGKGSVCAVVSSVLRLSGYTTGLFTSPFITDLREQIQIDNQMISEDDFTLVSEYVFSFVDLLREKGIIITEFEFTMAVAFEYFVRKACHVVVLEVGMGGLLDSTNVIKPPVCAVITPISLDHTGMLGNTIESIAHHKCGIIKEGTQVVSANQIAQVKSIIEQTCRDKAVPFVFVNNEDVSVLSTSIKGTKVVYKGEEYTLPLLGTHQTENLSVALGVLETLRESGFENINAESIRQGISNAKNPARFEVVGDKPAIIIDGAHNPEGMRTFADTVSSLLPHKKGILVMGMLRDKDVFTSLGYIKGMFKKVYTVKIENPRTMTAEELSEVCAEFFDEVEISSDVYTAIDKGIMSATDEDTFLCICGSLYLASQIRPYVINKAKDSH